ncbi:MAG TPA: riboflavin biosynthesis protein RibD, partial [Polyangiaceae bacterium]
MSAPASTPPAEVTFSADDEKWMAVALERGARGNPSPNPHVGAVVVKGAQAVGLGHHERAGEEHAEVAALREAG